MGKLLNMVAIEKQIKEEQKRNNLIESLSKVLCEEYDFKVKKEYTDGRLYFDSLNVQYSLNIEFRETSIEVRVLDNKINIPYELSIILNDYIDNRRDAILKILEKIFEDYVKNYTK